MISNKVKTSFKWQRTLTAPLPPPKKQKKWRVLENYLKKITEYIRIPVESHHCMAGLACYPPHYVCRVEVEYEDCSQVMDEVILSPKACCVHCPITEEILSVNSVKSNPLIPADAAAFHSSCVRSSCLLHTASSLTRGNSKVKPRFVCVFLEGA